MAFFSRIAGNAQRMAHHFGCYIRYVRATHSESPSDGVARIVTDVNCPPNLLHRTATDDDVLLRAAVASNVQCPTYILVALSRDKRTSVRSHVAANPTCPSRILELLAQDGNADVRHAAASNPECPTRLLSKLANDKHWFVVVRVLQREDCPLPALITKACYADEDYVRSEAKAILAAKDNSAWRAACNVGLTLNTLCTSDHCIKTIGDALIQEGLCEVYQKIQENSRHQSEELAEQHGFPLQLIPLHMQSAIVAEVN